jgi:hypothetical protein
MKSKMLNVKSIMSYSGARRIRRTFAISHSTFHIPRGISLIEVLISMFVLLFGLMGVAAIFPVASHYIQEGDKRDRSSGLAQIAFEELKSKKLLRPEWWLYPDHTQEYSFNTWVVSRSSSTIGQFSQAPTGNNNAGHAFVIDPLGGSAISAGPGRWYFPFAGSAARYPWPNLGYPTLAGTFVAPGANSPWPVRRVTPAIANPTSSSNFAPYVAMTQNGADMGFTLHDELVTLQPEAGDRPSIQMWRQNPSNGQMLSRQFNGNYSWLATVVPTRSSALLGLQPASNIKDEFYEITSVVLYKRDPTPSLTVGSSAGSERLIGAEFLNDGELVLYNDTSTVDTVDTALDGIKPTNWIAVCGVNPVNGAFMLKWYKILAMDDSSSQDNLPGAGNNRTVRYLMVDGPEWPEGRNSSGVAVGWQNLRAIVLPGVIDAYTQVMQVTNNFSKGLNEPPFMVLGGQRR